MDSYLQKESKWENINNESIRLYNKGKERIYTKKRKYIFIIKRGERKSAWVHWRTTEKRAYQTLEFTSNTTSFFHRKKNNKKYIV